MAIATTALIVTAIVTTVMAGAAGTYYATDGWGTGNKVKSGLDIKKEQEAKKALENANNIESNGRYFKPVRNSLINQSTQPTQPTRPTQLTKMTLPTVRTLPTLSTNYRWQEYTPQEQAQKKSELYIDRYDSKANRGLYSSLINTIGDAANNSRGPFSFLYNFTTSAIDNYIWDINGDGKDSMLKNIFVDPWIEVSQGNATWGDALRASFLNTLNSFTEVFDILANPIKGIANQGFDGFLNGLGLGGQGYVVYDWDTGNFGTDLLAELLSDPLNFAMIAKAPLKNTQKVLEAGATVSAKEVAEETLQAASKEAMQTALKSSSKDLIQKTSTRFVTTIAPAVNKEIGLEIAESATKELSDFLARKLVQNGFANVNDEILKGLYKEALNVILKKTGVKKITVFTLRNLKLEDITPDLIKALNKVAKESKDASLKKAYKALAKHGIIDNEIVPSNPTYLKKFQDIILDTTKDEFVDINKAVALGATVDVTKATDNIVARASQTLSKLGMPVTVDNLELLRKAAVEFMRDIDLNGMTARVLTSFNPAGRKLYMKLDKSIKWLSKIDDDLNVFQKWLSKIAWYGTAAPLPLLGKALKNTPYGALVSARAKNTGLWLKALFAKITNRAAIKFNKAIAEIMQDFTPESYVAMRKIFMDNTAVASEKLALDLQQGLIDSKDLKELTYTEAFQRSYISKFSKDVAYFDYLIKNSKDNAQYISQHWEQYIYKNYKMSSAQYLNYLNKINAIEASLTGNAVYSPFITRIKVNEAVMNINALNKTLDNTSSPIFKQGRKLSKAEIQALHPDIQILTKEEYNNTTFTLADKQAFIQTNNKAYTQQELYDKTSVLRKEYEARTDYVVDPDTNEVIEYTTEEAGTLLSKLKALNDKEVTELVDNIYEQLQDADYVDKMFKLLNNTALLGTASIDQQQEIYTSLIDAFMGLNTKVMGLDSADEITEVLASVAEQQLISRKIIKDASAGFLTNNIDFMINLRATLELYLSGIPSGKFVVKELYSIAKPLNDLTEILKTMRLDDELTSPLYKLNDEINNIINKNQDEIIIIPTEAYRTNADVFNAGSIHEALMQAAKGDLASTVQPIANGANMARFFSNVRSSAKFDVAVLEQAQRIADFASHIYNRVYLKEMTLESTKLIENAWQDILKAFKMDLGFNDTKMFYYKELVTLFENTTSLSTIEKYSLIKALYELQDLSSEAIKLHTIVYNIVNTPNNIELYSAIKNFNKLTNKPVTISTGFDINRAKGITYLDSTQRAIADLTSITQESAQILKGTDSLEAQIKNVSNSGPILALHTQQVRALKDFYFKHIEPFKALIHKNIDHKQRIELEHIASTFLNKEDLTTLKDLYAGVDDISPERLDRLERAINNRNNNLIDPDDPIFLTFDTNDFNEFVTLMTRDDLSDTELKYLITTYGDTIVTKNYVPNTLRKILSDEYAYYNTVRIKLEHAHKLYAGAAEHYGRLIHLNLSGDVTFKNLLNTYRHETVHEALGHMTTIERNRFVNQMYDTFLKDDKELIETMYLVTWYKYYEKHGAPSIYFISKDFTPNNVRVKEEVVCNLLAHVGDSNALHTQIASYANSLPSDTLQKLKDLKPKFKYSGIIEEKATIAYNELIRNAAKNSPNQIFETPRLIVGKHFDINAPFRKADKIIQEIKHANNNRMHYMMRKRLRQDPISFAKDLARTGPFQFYSISTLRNIKGDYGPYRYFDKDFNIRPKEYAELEAAGVHIVKYDDLDTIMFYIDKDKVSFDGATYYNKTRVDFTPEQFNWEGSLSDAGTSFNRAMYDITGQATGYSNGFRADENFYTSLFKGTNSSFESDLVSWTGIDNLNKGLGGWTLEDLTTNTYFNTYRFNEMVMGDNSYLRRFGIYQSSNPYVNMSNALQQAQMMNKTKTELLTMYFDNTFSTGAEGVFGKYTPEQLFKAYQNHPEMVLITLRGKSKGIGYRVQEFIPYTVADMQKAKELGARFVPRSWYNQMYNVLNNRIGSKGLLKWFNRYNFIYKFLTLSTNLMTFIRNAFDTYGKNTIELGEEMPYWTSYAWQLQVDYQNINNALRQLNKFSEKDIQEFFESGMSKAYTKATNFTYDMYKDLKHYEAWGPSTSGLADLVNNSKANPNSPNILRTNNALNDSTLATLEPTDDELMRMIARDTVPGYKGLWENAVDMSSQYFDFMNNTVGLKSEKVSRLALYLKATAEGKTREQAFQWIRNVHFDYSMRDLPEQTLELIMPFITFTMKNAEYWFKAIEEVPWVQRYLADYLQTQMNYYDFDNEERAASEQWQYLIKTGNIPLWKTDNNVQAYFKLNPSFMDAFNTFINPVEVLTNRMLLPIRAIEKTTTTDYKGQNLMGKQPIWNQVLDWTSFIPGNALARRITNAVKQPDTFSALTNDAIGKMKMYKPYKPRTSYSTKFVYNKDFTSRQLQTQPFRIQPNASKQVEYQQTRAQIARWSRARSLDLGKRILDPYRELGRNLSKSIFFNNTLPQVKLKPTKVNRNYLQLTRYRVQRGLFNR